MKEMARREELDFGTRAKEELLLGSREHQQCSAPS